MDSDVVGCSSNVTPYSGDIFNESFEILDQGVACATPSKAEHDLMETQKQDDVGEGSWISYRQAEEIRPKLFKTKNGLQRQATFNPVSSNMVDQREYFNETSRAVSSVAEEVGDDYTMEGVHSEEAGPSQPQPRCLRKMTLMIGKKILRFKVADAVRPNEDGSSERRLLAPGIFRCAQCHLTFHTKEDWSKHVNYAHSNKHFNCVVCGMGFNTKASLSIHHRTHSTLSYKPYQCNICHKAFSRASNHNLHMKMHQTGQRHFCSICGRCFKKAEILEDHQLTCIAHLNGEFIPTDRPLRYQCNYCDKWFHHKRDKFIHERIHTGEKPYQCGYCGRGFTQSQGLTIHIRLHTGERPYTCQMCGKQYRDNSALRKHEYKHHVPPADINNAYGNQELHENILEEEYAQNMWGQRT